MPFEADRRIASTGTRFRIFVLPPYAGADFAAVPETVTVSVPPEQLREGPGDSRFYVVDAVNKDPYSPFSGPPYTGAARPPVQPGPDGHFDAIPVDSPAFLAATMYATVRRTLDIWEAYFGRTIPWHFGIAFERMELIPAVNWDNAQSGYGFLEFGFARSPFGGPDRTRPYCENFDVLSHELGHSIIFSSVGVPQFRETETAEYGGFHESAADLAALVATLHFDTLVDHLLEHSHGNLFSINELTRIGEVSQSRQIRLAFNYEKMSTVGAEPHDLSLPLTGALFDVFVEVFQKQLLERELISAELAAAAMGPEGGFPDTAQIDAAFAEAYHGRAAAFRSCLIEARDHLGFLLADVWQHLRADGFTYTGVGAAALAADARLSGGAHAQTIRDCFVWREIVVPHDSPAMRRFLVDACAGRSAEAREWPRPARRAAAPVSTPGDARARSEARRG